MMTAGICGYSWASTTPMAPIPCLVLAGHLRRPGRLPRARDGPVQRMLAAARAARYPGCLWPWACWCSVGLAWAPYGCAGALTWAHRRALAGEQRRSIAGEARMEQRGG